MNIESILCDRKIVHSDPEIISGTLVFVGTRVPLQTFFDYLEDEEGLVEFLDDFPYLRSQILSILEIMAKMMLKLERETYARSAWRKLAKRKAEKAIDKCWAFRQKRKWYGLTRSQRSGVA